MSTLAYVAAAVVASLTGATFSQPVTAARKYLPAVDLANLATALHDGTDGFVGMRAHGSIRPLNALGLETSAVETECCSPASVNIVDNTHPMTQGLATGDNVLGVGTSAIGPPPVAFAAGT